MLTLLTILHVVVCVFLIVIVLLQHGKGADMGASFGGGSGQTVFGTEGPLPLLNKITTASAIVFMFTSVILAYYSANASKSSVMKSMRATAPVEKKLEVGPTPVEVPMTTGQEAGTKKETPAAPAQFPGTKATAPAAEQTAAPQGQPAEPATAKPETKDEVPAANADAKKEEVPAKK